MPSGYRVIYPRGNRNLLSVAYVRDYQQDEWDLASRQVFDDEDDAWVLCRDLANEHGLTTEDDPQPAYLD